MAGRCLWEFCNRKSGWWLFGRRRGSRRSGLSARCSFSSRPCGGTTPRCARTRARPTPAAKIPDYDRRFAELKALGFVPAGKTIDRFRFFTPLHWLWVSNGSRWFVSPDRKVLRRDLSARRRSPAADVRQHDLRRRWPARYVDGADWHGRRDWRTLSSRRDRRRGSRRARPRTREPRGGVQPRRRSPGQGGDGGRGGGGDAGSSPGRSSPATGSSVSTWSQRST